MATPSDQPPLDGLRVLDLSQYLPGPYATRLLCDLGAEVIKIEPPQGDPLRKMFGASPGTDSPVYCLLNRSKTIARLNLKEDGIMERLQPLITDADVMLESFRPGIMERLGLGYSGVSQFHDKLVYCSLSGYGQDGPMRSMAGHDINYCAAAGMFSYGNDESPPFPLVADHGGALNAVSVILAALYRRTLRGKGARLDVSLYESVLSYQYPATAVTDKQNPELRLLTGEAACYNFFRTKDRRVVTLGALEPGFWQNFCHAMEKPEWVNRQYDPLPQTDLIKEVREAIGNLTFRQLSTVLDGVDCCFEPVSRPEEIYAHRQTQFRELFAVDKLAYPAKIDGHQLVSGYPMQDLPVGVLPQWTHFS